MNDLLACLLPHRYGGFTVSQLHQLAHKAGIKASAANNHLGTKRDLCLALALSNFEQFHRQIGDIMSAQSVQKLTIEDQVSRASAVNVKAAGDLKHLHGEVQKELAKTVSLKTKVAVHVHIHEKAKKNWQNKQRSHVDRLETIQQKLAACQKQLETDENLLREQRINIDALKTQTQISNDSLDRVKVEVQHLKETDARLESALNLTKKYQATIQQAVKTSPDINKSTYSDNLEKLKITKQALIDSKRELQQQLSELPDAHPVVEEYTKTLAPLDGNIIQTADVLQLAKQTNAEIQTQMIKDAARQSVESVRDDAVKLSDRVTELQHHIDSMSAQTHPDKLNSLIADYQDVRTQAEQQHRVLLETQRNLSDASDDADVRLSEGVDNLMRDHGELVSMTKLSLQKLNSINRKLKMPDVSDDLSQIPSVIDAIDQKIAAEISNRNEMEQTLHAYQLSFEAKVKEVEAIAQTNVRELQSKNKTLVAELQACQQKLASNREQVNQIASRLEGKEARAQDLLDKMNALMNEKTELINELNSCKKALEVNSLAQQATKIKGVVGNPIEIGPQVGQQTLVSVEKLREEIYDHEKEKRQLAAEFQSMQETPPTEMNSDELQDKQNSLDNLKKKIDSKKDHVESLLQNFNEQTKLVKSQSDSLATQLELKDNEIRGLRSELAAQENAIQQNLTQAHEDINQEAQRKLDTMTSHILKMKTDPRLQVSDDERRLLDDRQDMHTGLISQEKALQDKLADIVAQKQRETVSLEADYRRQMLEQEKTFQSSLTDLNRQVAEDKLNTQNVLHQKDLNALTQQQALSKTLEEAGKAAIDQLQQQYQGELGRLQAEYTQRLEECSSARETLQQQANTSVQQLSLSNQDLERRLAVAADMQRQSEEKMNSLVEMYHALEGFAGEKHEQLQTLTKEYAGARDDFIRTQKINEAFQGESAAAHQAIDTFQRDRQQLLAAVNDLQFMVQKEHQAAENATTIVQQYGEVIQQQAKTIAELQHVKFDLNAAQQHIAALTEQMKKLEESRQLLERSCEEIHTSIQDLFEILHKSNLMGADMFRPIRGRKTIANTEMQAVHDIVHDYSHYRDEFERVKSDLRDSILQQSLILNSHEHGMLTETPPGQTDDETKKQLLETIDHKDKLALQLRQRNDAEYTQMNKEINKIASEPSSIAFLKRKEELLTDFLNKAVLQPAEENAETTSSTSTDKMAARTEVSSVITRNMDLLPETIKVAELFAENIPALEKVSTLSVEHEYTTRLFQYNEKVSKLQDAAESTLALLRLVPDWDDLKNLILAKLIVQIGVSPSTPATAERVHSTTRARNDNQINFNIFQGGERESAHTMSLKTKLIDVRAKMEQLKDDGKSIIKMLVPRTGGAMINKETMLQIIGKHISQKERYMGDLAKVLSARGGGKGKDLDVYQLTGIMKALNGVLIQNFKDLANYKASIRRQSEIEEKMLDMRDKLEKLMEYQEQLNEIARQSVDRALHLEEELMKHSRTARNLRMFLLGMREDASGDPIFSDKLNMFKYISSPDFDWTPVIGTWDASKLQTMSNWYLRVHKRLTSDAVKHAIDRAIRVYKEVEHADVLQNEAQRMDEMYNIQATIRQIIQHATLANDLLYKFDDLKPLLDWAQQQVDPDEESPEMNLTNDAAESASTDTAGPAGSGSTMTEAWQKFQTLLQRNPSVLSYLNPWLQGLLTGEQSTVAAENVNHPQIGQLFDKLLQQHPTVLSDFQSQWILDILTHLTGERIDKDVLETYAREGFGALFDRYPTLLSALEHPWFISLLTKLTSESNLPDQTPVEPDQTPIEAVSESNLPDQTPVEPDQTPVEAVSDPVTGNSQSGGGFTEEAVNGSSTAETPLAEPIVGHASTMSPAQRQQLVDSFFGLPSHGESEDSDPEASEVASVFDNLFNDWKTFFDRTIDNTRAVYHGVSSTTKGKDTAPTYRPVQVLIDETKGADLSAKKQVITAEMERLETLRFKKLVNRWKQRLMIDKLGDALGVIDLQLDHQSTIASLINENKACKTETNEIQARLEDCTQQTAAQDDKIADMQIKISEAQMRDDDYLAAFGVLILENTPSPTFETTENVDNLPADLSSHPRSIDINDDRRFSADGIHSSNLQPSLDDKIESQGPQTQNDLLQPVTKLSSDSDVIADWEQPLTQAPASGLQPLLELSQGAAHALESDEPTISNIIVPSQLGGKLAFNPRTIDEFLLQWRSKEPQDFDNFLQSQKDATEKQSAICSKKTRKVDPKSRKIVIRRRTRRHH